MIVADDCSKKLSVTKSVTYLGDGQTCKATFVFM